MFLPKTLHDNYHVTYTTSANIPSSPPVLPSQVYPGCYIYLGRKEGTGLGVADAHNWQNQLVHGRHWSGGIEYIPTSAHRAGTGGGVGVGWGHRGETEKGRQTDRGTDKGAREGGENPQ